MNRKPRSSSRSIIFALIGAPLVLIAFFAPLIISRIPLDDRVGILSIYCLGGILFWNSYKSFESRKTKIRPTMSISNETWLRLIVRKGGAVILIAIGAAFLFSAIFENLPMVHVGWTLSVAMVQIAIGTVSILIARRLWRNY